MNPRPPYTSIAAPRRTQIIQWLDHRLSALLAVILQGESRYLQETRYVYNASLEGSCVMARMLFEFLGVVPDGTGTIPPTKLRASTNSKIDDIGLKQIGLNPATREYFANENEERFIAEFLWAINKRTTHCTIDTIHTGARIDDLTKAAKIILRELADRFYGPSNPIEINAHLARDFQNGWEGFTFRGPSSI